MSYGRPVSDPYPYVLQPGDWPGCNQIAGVTLPHGWDFRFRQRCCPGFVRDGEHNAEVSCMWQGRHMQSFSYMDYDAKDTLRVIAFAARWISNVGNPLVTRRKNSGAGS